MGVKEGGRTSAKGPRPALGVDHSMLYSMQTLAAPRAGGTSGDVGDRIANPRNMKVRISVARSGRSFANTYKTHQVYNRLSGRGPPCLRSENVPR